MGTAILSTPVSLVRLTMLWVIASGSAVMASEVGAAKDSIILIVGGVISLIIGMVLASTVISAAVTAGTATGIGSFVGAQSLNDLVPLVYYAVVVMLGVGMIGTGGYRQVKGM